MSTTDQDRAAALAAKAADQRKRDTVKRANNRALRAMPADTADAVRARAVETMAAARANGDRRSSVYFLQDAILAAAIDHVIAEDHSEEETLTCRTCGKDKPLSEMPKHRRGKSGKNGQCRPCYNAQWQAWNAARQAAKVTT